MKHLIVTRFAVPRPESGTVDLYRSPAWLERRLQLFRRVFVPSVSRFGVPALLLCGKQARELVAPRVADLEWVRVEEQEEWRGGWSAGPETTITRLDSDDALRLGWFEAVDEAPASAQICITKNFLRWDLRADRLHRYSRTEPSPLSAFRGGRNPYEVDHKHLHSLSGVHEIRGSYLLQVVHGGNVSNHRPKPWRLDRRVPRQRLAAFALPPTAEKLGIGAE